MSYLGIDLGTSGLRALLVDDAGAPLGAAERSYPVANPAPGWSEQDPADWIAALEEAVAELRAHHPAFAALHGIGVSGQMHGATLLGHDGAVLRPCILWNDTRASAQAARLDATPGVRDLSGNIVFAGFTAPKLAWVQAHEPEVFAATAKVLLPAAFLTHYLTGEHVADMSDSAGTAWLDVGDRDWSDTLLNASGMEIGRMPRLVEGCAPAGRLRDDLKRAWGLSGDVVVAGGAGDNAAAACGIGVLAEGDGFVSLGTSGVVLMARDSYTPAPETAVHTFCHAVPGRWYQMGVMLSATDSLNWLSRMVGARPADLTGALGGTLGAPGAVRFFPYLSGERTPHNDTKVRGGFTGLATVTSREDLTRAVLEGVAYGLRDLAQALASAGASADALHVIGGGARSDYWLQLVATVLGVPLKVPDSRELGAALGAARLGLIAATGARPEDVIVGPKIARTVAPDPRHGAAYEDGYQAFRAAFAGLKAIQ